MMPTSRVLLAVMFLPVALSESQGAVDFRSGNTEIVDYYINDAVRVDPTVAKDPGTHLILESGASIYDNLDIYHNGRVTINDAEIRNRVSAWNNSRLAVRGGTIGDVVSFHDSQITVADNASVRFILGSMTGHIEVTGGTHHYVQAYDDSRIHVSGGTFDNLRVIENGIITLDGTDFTVGDASVSGFLDIPYLVGVGALNEEISRDHHQYWGVLSGTLADGTHFVVFQLKWHKVEGR